MTATYAEETQPAEFDSGFDTDIPEEKPKRRQIASWKRLLDDPLTREVIAGQLGIREEALTSNGPELSTAERAANTALAKMVGAVGAALREG